ncbi:hypothetical protein [Oxalobacter paraformigenes]|uniref:hypothetical protein n=1 Tax=Oxalobacter paraformigenes TaxID=556268 RepID=UPI0002FC09EE|nr:hypothetical protein [Oxalobacter paraformigenes]
MERDTGLASDISGMAPAPGRSIRDTGACFPSGVPGKGKNGCFGKTPDRQSA